MIFFFLIGFFLGGPLTLLDNVIANDFIRGNKRYLKKHSLETACGVIYSSALIIAGVSQYGIA